MSWSRQEVIHWRWAIMFPTSSTWNIGYLKMIGVIQDCWREGHMGKRGLTFADRTSLEHIGDTTLEFNSTWLKMESAVMMTKGLIELEANGFPKPKKESGEERISQTRHEIQMSVMFKSDILPLHKIHDMFTSIFPCYH